MGSKISAQVLKRVAEAVHGYREKEEIYVVAQRTTPFDLFVFATESEAADFLNASAQPDAYIILGPYGEDVADLRHAVAADRREPLSVEVTIKWSNDEESRYTFEGATDAVFLSSAAIEKFAVPYYTSLYGPEVAAKMSDGVVLGGHDRNTRWLPKVVVEKL